MAQKLVVYITGDDRQLQKTLSQSQRGISRFGEKSNAALKKQQKATQDLGAAESELFRLRARRASSIGPLRLAGIGLGAGTALFAATQAVGKLGSALEVTGDEAFTATGRMRNFTSSLLGGDIVGAIGGLRQLPKTLDEAGISAGEAFAEFDKFKKLAEDGGPFADLAKQAVGLVEGTRAAQAAADALADSVQRLGTAFVTSTGQAVTFKGAVDDVGGLRGPGAVDAINAALAAARGTTSGRIRRPIGPTAKNANAQVIAQANGDLNEVLRLQIIERDRLAKAVANSHGNVKQREALAADFARARAAVIATTKAIQAQNEAQAKADAEAAKAALTEKWDKIIATLSIGVAAAELTKPLNDDIAALKNLQKGLRRQIAAGEDVLGAQAELVTVAERIATKEEQRRQIAAQAVQASQFRALGLSATGEEIIPGADNLLKRFESLSDRLADSGTKIGSKLEQRFKLAGKLIRKEGDNLKDETRSVIDGILKDVAGTLDKASGPLTKTTSLNTRKLLEGLGLGRDMEKELRARLSSFNSAGQSLAGSVRPTGSFTPGTATVIVENHNTTTLDGEVVGRSVTRSQEKTRRRNPKAKRGSRSGI